MQVVIRDIEDNVVWLNMKSEILSIKFLIPLIMLKMEMSLMLLFEILGKY